MFSTSDFTGRIFCLRVVFALIFSGISFQGFAQTPFSWSSDPQEVFDQDTITLQYQVSLSSPGYEISFVHDLDTWSISTGCTPVIDLSGSWFCEDGLCSASFSMNEDRNEITVSITRPSANPVEGSGQILSLKGVVILIEDDWLRKEIQTKPSVRFYPNPVRQFVMIEFPEQKSPDRAILVRIYSDQGKEVLRKSITGQFVKLSVEDLAPGRYWLSIPSDELRASIHQLLVVD